MKRHPQHDDLRAAVQRFLHADWGQVLIVHEPDEQYEVMFHHDVRRVKRHKLDTEGETKHDPRLMFYQLAGRDPATFDRFASRLPQPPVPDEFRPGGFNVTVTSAEQGAELCLHVFRELYGAPADGWLFLTTIQDVDGWPSPLPKPAVWPPAG